MARSKITERSKTRGLSLYLLKQSHTDMQDALNLSAADVSQPLNMANGHSYLLAIRRKPPRLPSWADFFAGFVDDFLFGKISSSAAVLLVTIDGRIVALAFGAGRFLLKDDSWEERFGLKVVLNSVEKDHLRSIDKHTIDGVPKHASGEDTQG